MPAGNMPKGSPGADELWQHRDSQAARFDTTTFSFMLS